MHTKDMLAEALLAADLGDLAAKARTGYYHDFLSELPAPALQLDRDLVAAGTPAALALRKRHHQGDFDATRDESNDWAASPDGQEAFGKLRDDR